MAEIRQPLPAKLFSGILTAFPVLLPEIHKILSTKLGEPDCVSDVLVFDFTRYYQSEMGDKLSRQFLSFNKLISPDELASIKCWTNEIEQTLSERYKHLGVKRIINLDPGYIVSSKLVLATTKDYNHRIYIGQGIYAEVTLSFSDKRFTPWPWTYSDYQTKEYQVFFDKARLIYTRQLKSVT